MLTFDDIENANGTAPAVLTDYHGLVWVSMGYINISLVPTSGYDNMRASGVFIGVFKEPVTFTPSTTNKIITLNSFVAGAGWSNDVQLTVNGYYLGAQTNTFAVSLNMTYRTPIRLSWNRLDKVELIPSGSAYIDVGIDNLCITIENDTSNFSSF